MKKFGSLLGLMLFLAACSPEITYESDPGVDMKQYTTFEICPDDLLVLGDENPVYDNESNRKLIADRIRQELMAKGMKEQNGSSELFVNFDIQVTDKVQWTSSCTPNEENRYWEQCEIKEMNFEEGTLSIRFTDLAKNQVVWQGSASAAMVKRKVAVEKIIDEAIGEILRHFRE